MIRMFVSNANNPVHKFQFFPRNALLSNLPGSNQSFVPGNMVDFMWEGKPLPKTRNNEQKQGANIPWLSYLTIMALDIQCMSIYSVP